MSREGVVSFIPRVMADEQFRTRLQADPEGTLAQFDLTPEEVAAIKSADPARLEAVGVDERVSKTPTWLTPEGQAAAMGAQALGQVQNIYQLLSHIFWKTQ